MQRPEVKSEGESTPLIIDILTKAEQSESQAFPESSEPTSLHCNEKSHARKLQCKDLAKLNKGWPDATYLSSTPNDNVKKVRFNSKTQYPLGAWSPFCVSHTSKQKQEGERRVEKP